MICPNCSYDNQNGNLCQNCGVDIVLFKKTTKISDLFYNKALDQAKLNDLTGAIDTLNKSVGFNKNNCDARNLLGLIYFEIGHVGDALKHWVISSSIMKEENLATEYLGIIQEKGEYLENINDAINMYNQALEYIHQKSDDMAIIQLKKAIDLNPKFIDALNLLAFCALIQSDKERANELIKRVFAIDINNAIAINYYKELFPQKSRPSPVAKDIKIPEVQPAVAAYKPLKSKAKGNFEENFHLSEIISFLIGGACTLAIALILILPSISSNMEQENAEISSQLQTAQEQIAASNTKIQELESKNLELTEQNQDLTNTTVQQESSQKITAAASLYNEGKIEESADLLYSVDLTGISQETVDVANNLKAEVYPLAAKNYHDQGISKYNAGENAEAKVLLEKCLIFAPADVSYMDSVLYYLGLIAEEEGDIVTAKQYYEKIIAEYPNSDFASKASKRYNNLG